MPLRKAAIDCGIPDTELLDHVAQELLKPNEISYELQVLAKAAMKVGLEKLKEIARAGPRYSDELTTVVSTDLAAAQTLAKLGLDILKLSVSQNPEAAKGRIASANIQLDLWDSQGGWDLKKPGAD